jgi:hypothetical protein
VNDYKVVSGRVRFSFRMVLYRVGHDMGGFR